MMKAVIFDIDGVLLDSLEANTKFYQLMMEKFGYASPSKEQFSKMVHLSMWDVIRELTGLNDEEEIRKIWEVGKSRIVPYPDKLISVPAGARGVVSDLSEKYLLGVVTQRVKNNIFEDAEYAGLEKCFGTSIVFEDTKKHKPDPEPLLLCAQRLSVGPQECVYVGDAAIDLTAARAAGMKMILYAKEKIDGVDAFTSDFKKLPEIIEKL